MESKFVELIDQLRTILHTSIVEVAFKKVDGTFRNMRCTLREDLLPQKAASDKEVNRNRKWSEEVIVVYDLDKQAYRSFRKDSVQYYKLLGENE